MPVKIEEVIELEDEQKITIEIDEDVVNIHIKNHFDQSACVEMSHAEFKRMTETMSLFEEASNAIENLRS